MGAMGLRKRLASHLSVTIYVPSLAIASGGMIALRTDLPAETGGR
jgi:hypothetical protein